MDRANDKITLCGVLAGPPEPSHTTRACAFYRFPLAVERLSGTDDLINILVPEEKLSELQVRPAPRLLVRGEVRSYNNRSGVGPRLVITVLARELEFTDSDFDNRAELTGTLCREPTLRRTPMGREISDLMLAVSRPYGRSDYIPCIAWGAVARRAALWRVGEEVRVSGRLQSRTYIKLEGDTPVEKTAFEISAVTACRAEDEPEKS